MSANPVAIAYRGAAIQSALALQLPKHVTQMGSNALEVLTSAMPIIEGMDRIAGIGIQYQPNEQHRQPSTAGLPLNLSESKTTQI